MRKFPLSKSFKFVVNWTKASHWICPTSCFLAACARQIEFNTNSTFSFFLSLSGKSVCSYLLLHEWTVIWKNSLDLNPLIELEATTVGFVTRCWICNQVFYFNCRVFLDFLSSSFLMNLMSSVLFVHFVIVKAVSVTIT